MHIAHYYPWLYLTSGVERTILEICRRSRHSHAIFTNRWDRNNTYPGFASIEVHELVPVSVKRSLLPVLKASLRIAFSKLDLRGFDAMMIHCDGVGDLALIRNFDLPAICFCHTPLRPAFDDEYRKRVTAKYRGLRRAAFEVSRGAFRLLDRNLWPRYSHVLFNSRETQQRAARGGLLRGLDGRYNVLHPGIDWDTFQPSWTYENYFLVPGRIMWTKNIELSIEGYRHFMARRPESTFRLVVAGRVDEKSQNYMRSLRQTAAGLPGVEFVENPSDEQLWQLYRDCYSVVFPAFNEDWGLVPLEGNAFGKPVVAVDAGGPRESQIAGSTGMLVPADAVAFCQAMVLISENEELVRRMGKTGREHARAYHWANFVSSIDGLFERVVFGASTEPLIEQAPERSKQWI